MEFKSVVLTPTPAFVPLRSSNYLFQQDGASPHRARSTTTYLKKNRIRRFNRGEWPAMSPDMNPIEHVWPIVLRLLEGRVFSGRETLWAALKVAFAKVPVSDIKRLYSSMPSRIAALAKAKGGHTRY